MEHLDKAWKKKVRTQCYGLGRGGGSCLRHVARKASPKRAERPLRGVDQRRKQFAQEAWK